MYNQGVMKISSSLSFSHSILSKKEPQCYLYNRHIHKVSGTNTGITQVLPRHCFTIPLMALWIHNKKKKKEKSTNNNVFNNNKNNNNDKKIRIIN